MSKISSESEQGFMKYEAHTKFVYVTFDLTL